MSLRWYVVHAYSNFENKVKHSLEERVKRSGLEHKFGKVIVPTEEVVEMKEGQKRKSERKFFPGYVLVQMEMDDETWHLVKEVPKVLGFIGGTSDKPAPITDDEANAILHRVEEGVDKPLPKGERGGVELLLIHTVEHVGKQGQVVEVKPGYAYNYLIPHGLATMASDHHKRMVEKHKVKLQQIELARQADLRKEAAELAKQSITIEANATEDGHLYGSVGAPDIVAALKSNDIHLATDQIKLEGPLKELGLYTVKVRYSSEVEGELKVWVVPAVAADA